jgi:sugar phosphate isomerase/epimerase
MNPFHLPLLAFLALAATPGQAEPAPRAFFPMDTAVRDLAHLETLKQLGYSGVGWKMEAPEKLAEAVARIRQSGLELNAVYSYAGAILTKAGIVYPDPLDRQFAALAGTGALVWLPVASKEFEPSSAEGDEIAVPAFRELAGKAAKHGLRIALYPHTTAWVERFQDATRLAAKVDRDNFGATFNLCHCLMVGDEEAIPELLGKAPPKLFLVTINGADSGAARSTWQRLIRPLDEGDYDIAGFLRLLEGGGWRGPVGLQGYGLQLPVEQNLTRSMAAWRKLTPTIRKQP